MSVRTYNPSVRVGNWNEDVQLEEVCEVLCVGQIQYFSYFQTVGSVLSLFETFKFCFFWLELEQ